MTEKRKRGRPNLKGIGHSGPRVTVRVTAGQLERLQKLAEQKRVSVGDVVRSLVEMVANDPAGSVRLAAAVVTEDGPVQVDRLTLERAGQQRLPV